MREREREGEKERARRERAEWEGERFHTGYPLEGSGARDSPRRHARVACRYKRRRSRIINSINGRGKTAGVATIGLKSFSQREMLLSPSESDARISRLVLVSGTKCPAFSSSTSRDLRTANSMTVEDNFV